MMVRRYGKLRWGVSEATQLRSARGGVVFRAAMYSILLTVECGRICKLHFYVPTYFQAGIDLFILEYIINFLDLMS